MHKTQSFPLRIGAGERQRARRLARKMGLSENRLYADLIQEGLLMREQMTYLEKLRALRVQPEEGLAILASAPDVPPIRNDARPTPRTSKSEKSKPRPRQANQH